MWSIEARSPLLATLGGPIRDPLRFFRLFLKVTYLAVFAVLTPQQLSNEGLAAQPAGGPAQIL